MRKKADFAGWVTKNDIRCSDGVTIRHDAFRQSNGAQVPIVWQHDYSSPSNVLGYMILQHRDEGVYGYGYLNDTDHAQDTRTLLKHGDLNAMSIGARGIRKNGNDVIHGEIYEVSLVLKGANPGAVIEHVMLHSAYGTEEYESDRGVIYTGITQVLLHSDDSDEEVDEEKEGRMSRSYEELLEGLTDEELATLVNGVVEDIAEAIDAEDEEAQNELEINGLDEDTDFDEEDDDSNYDSEEDGFESEDGYSEGDDSADAGDSVSHSIFEGEDILKHNQFQGAADVDHKELDTLLHSAISGNASTLAGVLRANGVLGEDSIQHGLVGMETLFPQPATNGGLNVYNPSGLNIDKIMGQFGKSPLPRVKNLFANLTEDEARARGYIKGNQTLDSIEEVYFRETTPGSIHRRETIDHDDLIDLQDGGFAAVNFIQQVQTAKFKEEIVKAAFLSDGRDLTLSTGKRNPEKISELHIRPILKDHPLFTINITSATFKTAVDDVIKKAFPAYQGSGKPSLYINPFDLAKLKTLKDDNGRYLYAPSMDNNQVPGNANIAAYFMCEDVVEYRALPQGTFVIGNLADYQFGMSPNGQIATFDSFDIDFMQHKYLMHARLSGAIVTPKSFIVVKVTNPEATEETAVNFDSTGLKTKPTWTVQTDPTEVKGIGAKAVDYDAAVNNVDMTEDEKKLGTVETAPKPKKPKKAE
nr:MAG TPA: major capsid protein [Caudoviricetes sp.]